MHDAVVGRQAGMAGKGGCPGIRYLKNALLQESDSNVRPMNESTSESVCPAFRKSTSAWCTWETLSAATAADSASLCFLTSINESPGMSFGIILALELGVAEELDDLTTTEYQWRWRGTE